MKLGPLSFSLHRTVRVAANQKPANLPPSLGNFELYKVSDYKCPESWDKDAYFIAMHSKEAMWISFQTCEPIAVMIGAGSINALDGKPFNEKLEKDNYLVTPPQPWLDGWKTEDGSVYQFVATEAGENKTIGEQLAQTKDHAIVFSVYESKNPEKLQSCRVQQTWGDSEAGNLDFEVMSDCFEGFPPMRCCSFGTEMGLGKGGKIIQKIYDDPHGIEEWKESPTKTMRVYLINASEFSEITGKELPPPATEENYNGVWYGLEDEHLKDINGTKVFDKLKDAI
jgi:hypothetical protein